jgi:hypothetical protein
MSVARQYTTTPGSTRTRATRLVPAESTASSGPAVPISVLILGIVAILVAGWGAAAPFAGPDFGFVADKFTPWTWSSTSALLALAPGGLALLCGLWVVGASARPSYRRRPDLWLLGLVVALCGAWFVVGQYVWPVIQSRIFIVPSGATHFMWKELAFAIGPGVILVFCGATFMGWSVRRQLAVVAERPLPGRTAGEVPEATTTTRPVSSVPGTMAAPSPEPVMTTRQGLVRTEVARTGGVHARTEAAATGGVRTDVAGTRGVGTGGVHSRTEAAGSATRTATAPTPEAPTIRQR